MVTWCGIAVNGYSYCIRTLNDLRGASPSVPTRLRQGGMELCFFTNMLRKAQHVREKAKETYHAAAGDLRFIW